MKTSIFLLFFLLVLVAQNFVATKVVTEFDYTPSDITWAKSADWRR